jgi:malate synthase
VTQPTLIADAPHDQARSEILTADALAFLTELHHRFDPERRARLAARSEQQARRSAGERLDFLRSDSEARSGDWQVAPPRADYADRRIEITGPTDRKLVINALNSGARGFMADFEDANSPTWANQIDGQLNLRDAVEGTIEHTAGDGRHYKLNDTTATLLVRPRGLHLPEKHLRVDDEPLAGAFVDFGLSIFHLGRRLLDTGSAPYYYLPKLEHHLEARLWNDVFAWAQQALGLPPGSIRATVLIETLPAAFQMEEILFELRQHSYGLNAGRWDYIFSMIKCYRDRPEFLLPDRSDVRMTVPFMQAYTSLLVETCHRRGAFAMGGMAAVIPSRTDAHANERAFAGVRADKRREATSGFDGTWVAHPDLVDVALAEFDDVLGSTPNQIARQGAPVRVTAGDLLNAAATPGEITERGVRNNVSVAFQYLSFWLTGRGAAAINNLMEDAATAEISRSQLWQWIRHSAALPDGRTITRGLVSQILAEEIEQIRATVGEETWQAGRPAETRALFEQLVLTDAFPDFLTLPAYELID